MTHQAKEYKTNLLKDFLAQYPGLRYSLQWVTHYNNDDDCFSFWLLETEGCTFHIRELNQVFVITRTLRPFEIVTALNVSVNVLKREDLVVQSIIMLSRFKYSIQ